MEFPPVPEPHTLEVEATNHCSAKCVFCPHPRMERPKGFMDVELFERFVADLNTLRQDLWLNKAAGRLVFPKIVFAGLGEPTLHPQILRLVEICAQHEFICRVVTNGAHLTPELVSGLIDAKLSSLAVSLHSLNSSIYTAIMGLKLSRTLPGIKNAFAMLNDSKVEVEVWRVMAPPGMQRETTEDQADFDRFMSEYPEIKILGPSEPWSRDDTVPNSALPHADDSARGPIWCNNLYFTTNIAWDGTVVMCCVDYHRITMPLGNIFTDGFAEVQRRREAVYKATSGPAICRNCHKWADQEYEMLYETFINPNLTYG